MVGPRRPAATKRQDAPSLRTEPMHILPGTANHPGGVPWKETKDPSSTAEHASPGWPGTLKGLHTHGPSEAHAGQRPTGVPGLLMRPAPPHLHGLGEREPHRRHSVSPGSLGGSGWCARRPSLSLSRCPDRTVDFVATQQLISGRQPTAQLLEPPSLHPRRVPRDPRGRPRHDSW